MPRRVGLAVFIFGVACALCLGCLIAAYDLWGGVPRRMWGLSRILAVSSVSLLLAGGIGWLRSFPAGARGRAALRAALVMAVMAAAAGAALWSHYISRWQTSRLVCAPALIAPTGAERERAIAEGLGPLFPVIDPHSSCLALLRERTELLGDGTCPGFVMDDVPCRCGSQRWEPGSSPRCATGPTACQHRTGASTLGCAEHGTQHTLEEARRALAERGR